MSLHLCACLGPAPGEVLCFCQKAGRLPPEKRTTLGPDGAAIMRAIFEGNPMQNNIKWSAADAAALRELEPRRKLFNDVYMPKLSDTLKRVFGSRHFAGEGVAAMAFILSQHADEVRDALKPFDSGVRPAQPAERT